MKIAVAGCGYVGLVSGVCLADVGHQVCCVDIDPVKVDKLKKGEIHIFEPGLETLVKNNLASGTLAFSADLPAVLQEVEAVFIAVGTPPDGNGFTDLRHVCAVAETIGQCMQHSLLVICKSTAPVGTCSRVRRIIAQQLLARKSSLEFQVVSNPEFLKEGSAVNDFMRPDRIIVGSDSEAAIEKMREIYAPFNRNHDRIVSMSVRSSELTKYAANAMLATKISFINEVANIAERVGADIEEVRQGIGSDPRIGYDFIYAGCGYGGSCFPKDVTSLLRTAEYHDYYPQLIAGVESVNQRQKMVLVKRLKEFFAGNLAEKRIAIWGLAFKPNTDDIREAPSRLALEYLLQQGVQVRAYDPAAMEEIGKVYGSYPNLHLVDCKEDAIKEADALLIFTEWKTFKVMDHEMVRELMATPVIFDGRNLYDPARMKQEGFVYYAIGRGDSVNKPPGQETSQPANTSAIAATELRAIN